LIDKTFAGFLVNLRKPISKEAVKKGIARTRKYHDMRLGERPLIAKNTAGAIIIPSSLKRDEGRERSSPVFIFSLSITLFKNIVVPLEGEL
jgi:hypothetical protein